MKKTTSFHLEEDILNEITAYQKQHNLSSRNVALERMLLERRFFLTAPRVERVEKIEKADKVEEVKEEQKKNKMIGKSLNSTFDGMPD
jgi:hypothetical protein